MNYVKQMRRSISRLGLGFSAFLLTGYLLQVELMMVFRLLDNMGIFVSDNLQGLLLGMSLYLGGAPVCWLIVRGMPVFGKPSRGRFTVYHLAIVFLVSFSILYIGNIMGLAFMNLLNWLWRRRAANPLGGLINQLNPWSLFFLTVVAAPLFEEFLFRKLLIDRVQQYGDVTAILLSATLFGLSHGNFYQFFYAFGLGVIFAYVYVNTGKLRYTIALHGIINFTGSTVMTYLWKSSPFFLLSYLTFLLLAIILSIIFGVIFWGEIRLRPAPVRLSLERYLGIFVLNGGLLLFLGVTAAVFLLMIFS